MSLEDLKPGVRVQGVVPDGPVEVVQVTWHGTSAVTLTYRDQEGRPGHELLYRADEDRLALEEPGPAWAFDVDGKLFRLVSEALRIRLAYLFDPYLAIHTSNLEPLPHQITAVYDEMLPRQPLRFLLADDPGAGKTIMAGLLIKELMVRGDLRRCLIVAPGNLVEQWQDELWQKLGLEFDIVQRETVETSRSGNPFVERNLVISRLDHLSRSDDVQAKLTHTEWDLVVVDEAHKMSAHFFGNEVKETKRYRLGKLLGDITRHLLLMTATPHSGKEEDFQLFMALVDPDRFEGRPRGRAHQIDAQGMMRRLVKEKLLKFDGTRVHTLWGELAYQLGGKEAYDAFVAEDDRRGTNPGEALIALFERYTPCLVLIDEWLAYARQLYGVDGLPAGSFDTQFTFAQALTDAARRVPNALLVVSIPASDIEVGGEGGREALKRLHNVVSRMEASWKPATADEGFEIVRRRLFDDIPPNVERERDAVVRSFGDLYRAHRGEFPPECREGDYERRLRASYPIHPELFDRLYGEWSTLERFQRTRGVLRLMAGVIHELWEQNDRSLLILPGSLPVYAGPVMAELTRHLDEAWTPVIATDIDGENSLPLRLDRENPGTFGRYSAARRVARTVFMGSAPVAEAANRGIDDRRIKLGCVQPGESAATFGDALRRLSNRATYLNTDGQRYWYSPQQTVTRLAADRAGLVSADRVDDEIRQRLRGGRERGDFTSVHAAPLSPGDVHDEPSARLVILGPEHSHSSKTEESPGRDFAARILDERAGGPRLHRNMLVFLAPDTARLEELREAARQFRAWRSIDDEKDSLNLDTVQRAQTDAWAKEWDDSVTQRIHEAYQWLLVPAASKDDPAVRWESTRVSGSEPLPVLASRKLRMEEGLIVKYSGARLRMDLDRIPLWRGDYVHARQLWSDYAQYLYLPRLRDASVLADAIRDGVALLTWESDAFAYADAWDEERARYAGLRAGEQVYVSPDPSGLVVKSDVARRQLDQEGEIGVPGPGGEGGLSGGTEEEGKDGDTEQRELKARPRRFYGSVTLDPVRLSRDAGQVAEAIVQHLAGLVGAKVEVRLEVQAEIPDGAPDDIVRTVTENARTLKFDSHGFERE